MGDQVRIDGFLGVFEVVRVDRNGLMVDLKHLGRHGSDYIEKEILTRELDYVEPQRQAVPINGIARSGITNSGLAKPGAAKVAIAKAYANGNGHSNGTRDAKESWQGNGTNSRVAFNS